MTIDSHGRYDSPPIDAAPAVEASDRPRRFVSGLLTFLRYAIGFGLIAVLLTLVAEPAETKESLLAIEPGWLALALVALMSSIVAASLRWLLLLRVQGVDQSLGRLTYLWLAGFFFDNLLPSNVGGDVARGYGLTRNGISLGTTVSSLLVGRILALVALGAWGGLALLSHEIRESAVLSMPNLVGGLIGAGGMVVLIGAVCWAGIDRIKYQPAEGTFAAKLVDFMRNLWTDVRLYRHQPAVLVWCFGISMVMWLLEAVVLLSCLHGIGVNIPYQDVIGLNTTLSWAGVIPVSVGGAGIQEGTLVVLLREFAVAGSLAMAVGLSYRAVRLAVALAGGAALLVRSSLS